MLSKKRRRIEPPTTHPRNKYNEKPPDFRLLASLYPSFHPFVSYSSSGRPNIEWTDFNATRELTRILLLHDHGVHWWIPDGHLCPTVPNRSNYIHWIGDLLSSEIIPKKECGDLNGKVRGFDIGTGANCIYPLLGASLFQWSFVGSDVTEVALEWSKKNVESNPHLSELIEIRCAANKIQCTEVVSCAFGKEIQQVVSREDETASESFLGGENYKRENVLVGVVRDGEEFEFCMCNPPFFERMEEAGLNPRTACGGSFEEMVYPGGELAFITRIIEDSLELKLSFRWFTSMVGKKANLKLLVSKLRESGVSIVKTTEFVQGQTARWGLAWSFVSPNKKSMLSHAPAQNNYSFTIEGLQRQSGAIHVLKAIESFFLSSFAICKCDFSSFVINVTFPSERIDAILRNNGSGSSQLPHDDLQFRVSVFEQIPGTVLVKASSLTRGDPVSGTFSLLVRNLEEHLKKEFIKKAQQLSKD